MRLFNATCFWWLIVGLLLFACLWLCAQVAPADPAAEVPLALGGFALLVCLLFWLLTALAGAARWLEQIRCEIVAGHLERRVEDLDSPHPWKRRRALQALADFSGHPFGYVACWPFQLQSPRDLDTAVALYKAWWRRCRQWRREVDCGALDQDPASVFKSVVEDLPVFRRHLPPGASSSFDPQGEGLRHLPPVVREEFLAAMRDKVEQILAGVAEAINRIPLGHSMATGVERVSDLFAVLRWEALDQGWQLRFDAADAMLTALQHKALAGNGDVPLPPEGDLPASRGMARGWVEKYRLMRTGELDPCRPEADPVGDGDNSIASPPVPQSWSELMESLRGKVQEALEHAADAIKDALLDWDLANDCGTPEPLPPLTRDHFVEAMRGKVEETLRHLTETADQATVEEHVRDLLTELLWDALKMGLQMRQDAAGQQVLS